MAKDEQGKQGRRIGRYNVVAEVGRGGMGLVYRAEDRMIGRDVAVKTLTEVTPELRERFYVEARSGILSHPNIVTVYELGEDDGIPFIAMEFLPGKSLEQILHASARLPIVQALSIAEQLCAGLGYAHQHGLVHRDVKPANTMVLPDGRVKIVDFGIAKLADQATHMTRADALLGTFHYIAPERLKGDASDGRADIWSVGVMLYEMIAGELPFQGKDISALYRMMNDSYKPLCDLPESASGDLTAILDRALAKDVARRYATAELMQVDLQKLREALKDTETEQLLEDANRIMGEGRFLDARAIALQVQGIDPGNLRARMLLQDAQESLNKLQREKHLREMLEQAEEAFSARRFDEANSLFSQALKLDEEGAYPLAERLEAVQVAQEQLRRVRSLLELSNEARGRGDLQRALAVLDEGLETNERNTELREAHGILLRQIRQTEDAAKVDTLLQNAREEIGQRRYTTAITRLREAVEIDPTHDEVQQLLLSTVSRQREERRRQVLEQVVDEIQESLNADDLPKTRDFLTRALDTLPSEPVLLGLKAELDRRERDKEVETLVRAAVLEAQALWEELPEEAIARVDAALANVPGEARLLKFRARLEEHQDERRRQERQSERSLLARQWMDQGRVDDAVAELEAAVLEADANEELKGLLRLAREQQASVRKQKERDGLVQEVQQLLRENQYDKVLELVAENEVDPELATLRSTAERRRRELEDRVSAVVVTASALMAKDLTGAIRLLNDQPAEVKQSSAVATLRSELARAEVEEATIAAAIERSNALLRKGDLDGSGKLIDRLSGDFGEDDPRIASAKTDFLKRRRAAADLQVKEVLQHGEETLRRGRAVDVLRQINRCKRAAEFASSTVREELDQLKAKAHGVRSQGKTSSIWRNGNQPGTNSWLVIAAVLALVFGGAAAALHARHTSLEKHTPSNLFASQGQSSAAPPKGAFPSPALTARSDAMGGVKSTGQGPANDGAAKQSAAGTTYLELEAKPWATVMTVTAEDGQPVKPLADQSASTTPLRLDGLSEGSYHVTLRSPAGEERAVTCDISATKHMCMTVFQDPDVSELLKGGR